MEFCPNKDNTNDVGEFWVCFCVDFSFLIHRKCFVCDFFVCCCCCCCVVCVRNSSSFFFYFYCSKLVHCEYSCCCYCWTHKQLIRLNIKIGWYIHTVRTKWSFSCNETRKKHKHFSRLNVITAPPCIEILFQAVKYFFAFCIYIYMYVLVRIIFSTNE